MAIAFVLSVEVAFYYLGRVEQQCGTTVFSIHLSHRTGIRKGFQRNTSAMVTLGCCPCIPFSSLHLTISTQEVLFQSNQHLSHRKALIPEAINTLFHYHKIMYVRKC